MPSKAGRFATLTSWSYSVYTQYVKCPFSVCLDKIMRVRIEEPPNPAFEKGDRVHSAADVHVGGMGKPPKLPKEMAHLKARLDGLRKAKARTEQEWAFDRDWMPVSWTDWKRAWLRIKTDVCADTLKPPTVDIVDWKTGRVYDDHKQQRSLYALGGLRLVQIGTLAGGSNDVTLTASHVYTDTGQTATETFGMASLEPLKREWLARTREMMSDTRFPTRTGPHCRWCRFRKSNGGPCPEDQ
jgi:PD-(D/E)XK nuclease superfamily